MTYRPQKGHLTLYEGQMWLILDVYSEDDPRQENDPSLAWRMGAEGRTVLIARAEQQEGTFADPMPVWDWSLSQPDPTMLHTEIIRPGFPNQKVTMDIGPDGVLFSLHEVSGGPRYRGITHGRSVPLARLTPDGRLKLEPAALAMSGLVYQDGHIAIVTEKDP